MNNSGQILRQLVDTYEQTQRMRIQLGNRRDALVRGVDEPPVDATFLTEAPQKLYNRLRESEKELVHEMQHYVRQHPAWPWLTQVRGIGPTLGAKVLGLIGDISLAPTASALWRFAGYAVIDGERERLKKGEKSHYNRRLKTACYLIGMSFIKLKSPYRKIYDDAKVYYQGTHPEWTKIHIHRAAMRKMVKVFLAHLWYEWRAAEGMEARNLYVLEYKKADGHTYYIDSKQFLGEPKVE